MADPATMSAIAMAESGGNPRAHNAVPPDNSYGLWQINMFGNMGPGRRAQYGISSNEQLYDPAVNARAAAKILAGQGLGAWSTYTSGAYKKYMGGSSGNATPIIDWNDPFNLWPDDWGDAPGSPGGDTLNQWGGGDGSTSQSLDPGIADVAKGVGAIAEATLKAGVWLSNSKNWVRIGYVVGGGLLVGIGVTIIAKPAIQKVASVTPAGKLAKKAGGALKSRRTAKAAAKSKPDEVEETDSE